MANASTAHVCQLRQDQTPCQVLLLVSNRQCQQFCVFDTLTFGVNAEDSLRYVGNKDCWGLALVGCMRVVASCVHNACQAGRILY